MIATMTSKGQLTVPKFVRDKLALRAGDRLDFVLRDNGLLEVVPLKQPASKLKGMLPRPKRSLSVEEINEAIAQEACLHDRA